MDLVDILPDNTGLKFHTAPPPLLSVILRSRSRTLKFYDEVFG